MVESPPSFVVCTEAQKAAWDNGYRLERGVEDGWLRYGSTTAPGSIWIGGVSGRGPWLLSLDNSGVAAEIGGLPPSSESGPGLATFMLTNLTDLHAALDRVYKLSMSLPEAPLARFKAKTANLPRTTEAERIVIHASARKSSVPWADCTDAQRLDVHNGLLLSALWDAAFDRALISFADDGTVLASPRLSETARSALGLGGVPPLGGLRDAHRTNLAIHRTRNGFG
jgi:hypothetical protein